MTGAVVTHSDQRCVVKGVGKSMQGMGWRVWDEGIARSISEERKQGTVSAVGKTSGEGWSE